MHRATVLDVAGPDKADIARVMRVRFDEFVKSLVSLGDPDEEDLRAFLAGADLVLALAHESDDFGRAAPRAGSEADFAERLMALTDEAFDVAAELLNDEIHDDAPERNLTGRAAARRAVSDLAFDEDIYPAVTGALLECSPRVEAAVAGEFV